MKPIDLAIRIKRVELQLEKLQGSIISAQLKRIELQEKIKKLKEELNG